MAQDITVQIPRGLSTGKGSPELTQMLVCPLHQHSPKRALDASWQVLELETFLNLQEEALLCCWASYLLLQLEHSFPLTGPLQPCAPFWCATYCSFS